MCDKSQQSYETPNRRSDQCIVDCRPIEGAPVRLLTMANDELGVVRTEARGETLFAASFLRASASGATQGFACAVGRADRSNLHSWACVLAGQCERSTQLYLASIGTPWMISMIPNPRML